MDQVGTVGLVAWMATKWIIFWLLILATWLTATITGIALGVSKKDWSWWARATAIVLGVLSGPAILEVLIQVYAFTCTRSGDVCY